MRPRSGGRRVRRVVGALLLAIPLLAGARGLPPAVEAVSGALEPAGEGEMRWFGFKLYDIALWVERAAAGSPDADHLLAIRYARSIPGERLVDTSIDEMRRMGWDDEARLERWRDALRRALPAVEAGDTLIGLHQPGQGARFWHQGRPTAEIADPEFARAFFDIWLGERTREPALRTRLLGRSGASP